VLVGWSLTTLAVGQSDVAEVELALEALDGGNFGLGVLLAASGFGLILGSLGADWVVGRFGTAAAYGASIAAMALGLGAVAVSPNVWVASVFVIATGIGNGVAVVANSLLVQRGTPDAMRGRAFTLAMSVTYSALFVGMILGGFVSDAVGPRWTWAIAAMLTGVAAVVAYLMARGVPSAEGEAAAEPSPVVSAAAASPAEVTAHRE
jgi:MFS family permease